MGRNKSYIREQVIENALETFWMRGYHATSLSDLTEATGLNKKSLYNEFGPKEELFNVVMDHYRLKKANQIQLLRQEPLGVQNVIDFLEQLVTDSSIKGCLLCLSINEKELLESNAASNVKSDFSGLTKIIEANFNGIADAKALSLLISSQIFSVAGLGKLKYSKKELKSALELIITNILRPLK